MTFWQEVLSGFLGDLFAGFALVLGYVAVQWFLRVTDITIGYGWKFDGTMDRPTNIRPAFDIRNLSRTRTYSLSNIAYLRNKRPVASFDNQSLWGAELGPGKILFLEAAPVSQFNSLADAQAAEVHVRLQGKRLFWLKGIGPGAARLPIFQRFAFRLRDRLERMAFPLE